MLKPAKLQKNLLILVDEVKKDEIISKNVFDKTSKNLFKFQKLKKLAK